MNATNRFFILRLLPFLTCFTPATYLAGDDTKELQIPSELVQIVSAGKTTEFQEYLQRNPASVQAVGESNALPHLIVASRSSVKERLKMFEFFKARGGDLNAPDKYGDTCLNKAIEDGQIELALGLVQLGVDGSIQGRGGRIALHVLASISPSENAENIRLADILLSKSPTLVNSKDAAGLTPLYFAIQKLNEKLVKWLVDHGANPDVPDATGDTPLLLAKYLVLSADTTSAEESAKRMLQILQTDQKANRISP